MPTPRDVHFVHPAPRSHFEEFFGLHAQSAESAPAADQSDLGSADAEFQDTVNPNWRACESVRALFATRALESYKKITESAELDGYEQELLQILTQMRAQPCTSNAGRSPNKTHSCPSHSDLATSFTSLAKTKVRH